MYIYFIFSIKLKPVCCLLFMNFQNKQVHSIHWLKDPTVCEIMFPEGSISQFIGEFHHEDLHCLLPSSFSG